MGHAFVANMTGNTVLLGAGCFFTATCCTRVFRWSVMQREPRWRSILRGMFARVRVAPRSFEYLGVGVGSAVATAIGWALAGRNSTNLDPRRPRLLLGGVALAIGIQSGAMLQLRIPGIVTTYITGTWTTLMRGLTRFVTREQHRPSGKKVEYEERMVMQGGILFAYLLSAVATGLLFRYARLAVGVLPALSVLLVAVYALAHRPAISMSWLY